AMTVALVDISKSLGFDTASTQWIMSSYIVTFGGFLLLAGRVGDMYGHRKVFLIGQIWFGLWSLIVSFSTSPAMFCITRALQGIGASMSVPTALGLITTTLPAGPKRTRALSIFGGFGAAGAVVGLLLAGALISSMSWHWIFRFSAIFSFILFGLGFLAIPERTSVSSTKVKIDVAGALTATSSLICIIYYISTGSDMGWGSVKTVPVLAAGLVLMGLFLWIEMRLVQNPIMPLRIWRLSNFSSAFVAILFLQGQFQGFCYFATLIFQNVMGYTSMQTSLAFLAHSIATIIAFTILGKILPKYRLKPFILTGFVFRCAAALMFAFVTTTTSYWTLPFLGLLVHVIGLGTSVLPAQITALKDAQNEDQGVVGAMYSTGMQLGAPLGLAIVTVISENTV
ncbi:major facilitator superfamily domain-containing protein, partial [Mortierella sp. GBAus27b]